MTKTGMSRFRMIFNVRSLHDTMNTDCNNKDRLPSNGIPFTDEEPDEEGVSVYEHHRLTADSGQKPMRIDKFLMEHLYNTSRNRLQRAAEQESSS